MVAASPLAAATSRPLILITGAAGFVGRHTTVAFHRRGYQITAVDLRPAPGPLLDAASWRFQSFTAPELLVDVAAGRYDVVVHQAGISDTRAAAGPELDETNTVGVLRLADACRAGGARLIYASSHAVYGTLHQRLAIAENADADAARCSGPLNPYAATKLALDQQMRARHVTGLSWVGLRYTNVVGPDEADKGPMASILSQLLRQAAHTGRVRLFDDSLTAARDYIPVEVVAATIVQLAEHPVALGVYNLGSGVAVSFAELLQWCAYLRRVAERSPLQIEMVPNPAPAAYQYFTCADNSALDAALPGRPTTSAGDIENRAATLFSVFSRSNPGAGTAARRAHSHTGKK